MDIEKLFEDLDFINSREGRPVRILAEFLEAKTKLEKHNINNTIVMFGSARIKDPKEAQQLLDQAKKENATNIKTFEDMVYISKYYQAAQELAYRFAMWSKNTFAQRPLDKFYICTGGGGGIMEACNRGAKDANEKSIGFNISLPFEQTANPYLEKDFIFDFNYFFLRKFWFSYLAKAFLVFPGGFGTMDELFEVLTLIQTHKMRKIVPIVLFGKDFFEPLINMDLFVKYSLIKEEDKKLFIITDDMEEAYSYVINGIKPQ
jgi:uncharacterized protein (TIGR00730 family)